MSPRLTELWVYLAASPLMGLTLTLLAYQAAHWLYRRAGQQPWANPVAIAMSIVIGVLWLTHTPYQTYFSGAQFVHFLLGPATVALALPLYAQMPRLKQMAGPLLWALGIGSLTAAGSAVLIGAWCGGSGATLKSLAPKSVTTPIAMGVAEKIGGIPSLTAVLVIVTGVIGAVLSRPLLNLLRIEDLAVRGFAIGVSAHGIGTARAFQENEITGAFSALAMGLNGALTAVLLPILYHAWT